MAIAAAQVKELRQRTGSGMMECKKALVQTDGDIEAAIEWMRKNGLAKADKKAGRIAAEGRVAIEISGDKAVLVEINSETDFVANGDVFQNFAADVAKAALVAADMDALNGTIITGGETIDNTRREMISKLGENISVRRFDSVSGPVVGYYAHGAKIGVVVALEGGNVDLAKDVAMHIAAAQPRCVTPDEVAPEVVAKEREILIEQAAQSGKPPEIIEKMIEGRMKKWLAEITLVGQSFIKDPDITVAKLLAKSDAKVLSFVRFEVGEGIEKKQDDFAAEVMAQVRGG